MNHKYENIYSCKQAKNQARKDMKCAGISFTFIIYTEPQLRFLKKRDIETRELERLRKQFTITVEDFDLSD